MIKSKAQCKIALVNRGIRASIKKFSDHISRKKTHCTAVRPMSCKTVHHESNDSTMRLNGLACPHSRAVVEKVDFFEIFI